MPLNQLLYRYLLLKYFLYCLLQEDCSANCQQVSKKLQLSGNEKSYVTWKKLSTCHPSKNKAYCRMPEMKNK